MIELRGYQDSGAAAVGEAYDAGATWILLVMACGSGKTATASVMIERILDALAPGECALWLAHRRELVFQASRDLGKLGVDHGVILAGQPRRPGARVHVSSIPTLIADGEVPDHVRVVVIDEAHHATAATWRAILRACPRVVLVLGLTGTPQRGDGTGLGDAGFERLIVGASVADMEDLWRRDPTQGLVPSVVRAPRGGGERGSLGDDPVKILRGLPLHSRALVFCDSVAHAHEVATRATLEGVPTLAVDASTDDDVRARVALDLERGRYRAIANVAVYTEGTDLPCVDTTIHCKPLKVWSLWIQTCSRAKRPYPGKRLAVHWALRGGVNNVGLPADPVAFSLKGTGAETQGDRSALVLRQCPRCLAVCRPTGDACPYCGARVPPPRQPRVRRVTFEDVKEAKPKLTEAEEHALYRRLIAQGKAMRTKAGRPYKPGWAKEAFMRETGHWPRKLPEGST